MTAVLYGLRELQTAAAQSGREMRLYANAELRHAAEPVARTSEANAMGNIRRMPRSPKWSKMRVGVNRTLVYVAPVERGVKRKGHLYRHRPNLAGLLLERAMEPALAAHEADVTRAVETAVDHVIARLNQGGAP